ncbi:MAG: Crp/Fnr family transcriptional regulator [Crocinitomicaceae bacterium]|nr:Crp/Fnr family transcriptional regulator [Crocinitomicaceae bacterium]
MIDVANMFPLLTESELIEEIQEVGVVLEFKEGEDIITSGKYIKSIPLLVKGAIRVLRNNGDGNEVFLYFVNKGQTCAVSLACCVNHKKSNIRAVAETDCEFVSIPIDYLEKWNKKYQSWRNFMLITYQSRFDEVMQALDSIAFLKLDERLIQYIEDKARVHGKNYINITHQKIAEELNTSREVVSRLLKKAEEDGEVELSRNKITIPGMISV